MCSTYVFSGYSYLFRYFEFWQEKGANGTCVKWNSFSSRWTFLPKFAEFFGKLKKPVAVFTTVKEETDWLERPRTFIERYFKPPCLSS